MSFNILKLNKLVDPPLLNLFLLCEDRQYFGFILCVSYVQKLYKLQQCHRRYEFLHNTILTYTFVHINNIINFFLFLVL
jgi:hypothetical protein